MPLDVIEAIDLKHDGLAGRLLDDKRFVIVEDHAYFSSIKQLE